jgi:16S rRNA processing protein RimM
LATRTVSGTSVPEDLVLVGYVSGAYGLNGWIRIKPYSTDADALLYAKTWWIDKPEFHDVEMRQVKSHSGDIVAQLMGIADRDAAEALCGATVQISRKHFPALTDGEFYWIDLIGLEVENLQGESLGVVKDLMDNGAHPILRVIALNGENTEKVSQELLIPFVDRFVKTVDQKTKKMTVDWERDY